MLKRPLTIYVDESGSPVFGQPKVGEWPQGYVPCAVAIPELLRPALEGLIPRSADGTLLKSSSLELSDERLASFLDRALQTRIEVALVLIDASSQVNASRAAEVTELSNERRRLRGNPRTKTPHLIYTLATRNAIIAAWTRASSAMGSPIGYLDIVLDEQAIPTHARRLYVEIFENEWRGKGLADPHVTWQSSGTEPLLHVPDLFASVYRRQAARHDVPRSFAILEGALGAGRISVNDEFTTPGKRPETED